MARNTDGTLAAFFVDPSGEVLFTQQFTPRGRWAPWKWLTNNALDIKGKSLAVAQNQDGRLELFLVGTGNPSLKNGGDLLHCWQTSPGGAWSEWQTILGHDSVLSPTHGNVIAAAQNKDGTLALFIIMPDLGVYLRQQLAPGGSWTNWQRLTHEALDIRGNSLAVTQRQDGGLELFLIGTNQDVLHLSQQDSDGQWGEWSILSFQGLTAAPLPGTRLAATRNSDGTLEVFVLGADLGVLGNRQSAPGGEWLGWQPISNAALRITGTSLAVSPPRDGPLELFLVGEGQDVLHTRQDAPNGSWMEWTLLKEQNSTLELAVGINADETLELFNIGTRQEVRHTWQNSPGESWHPAWSLRGRADSVITNDVPAGAEMEQRIATEHSLPGIGSEILPIHAALLHNGKVLYFGGSQYSIQPGEPRYEEAADSTRLWNPSTHDVELEGSPMRADPHPLTRVHDLFCCGHALLPDGQLLVAGGYAGVHARGGFDTNPGLRNTAIYSPSTRQWTATGDMTRNPAQPGALDTGGSWYPTLLTLPSGKVVSMLGFPAIEDLRENNTTVEVFDPSTGGWVNQNSDVPTPSSRKGPAYPRLHLLPDGRVFSTTPFTGVSGSEPERCYTWDPATRAWSALVPAPEGFKFGDWSNLHTSVLLPLRASEGYRARLLAVGASKPQLLDLGQPQPAWQPTGPRVLEGDPPRDNCCAVLLPTGQVLVLGGHFSEGHDHDGGTHARHVILTVELYDPFTNRWQIVADAQVTREYHTVALLLPDGRVWTAGSQKECAPGLQNRELRIEVFSPPYFFRRARPTISNAPLDLTPGASQPFSISTPQAGKVTRVTLVRCGSTTHGYDADQRCIELSILSRSATSVQVAAPPNNNVAPPGYYLLFVIDGDSVPSVGHSVKIHIAPGA
ncbi:MAG TPA: galactose oxidase-like domain-containing protein [Myxococcaceae bacterium]